MTLWLTARQDFSEAIAELKSKRQTIDSGRMAAEKMRTMGWRSNGAVGGDAYPRRIGRRVQPFKGDNASAHAKLVLDAAPPRQISQLRSLRAYSGELTARSL